MTGEGIPPLQGVRGGGRPDPGRRWQTRSALPPCSIILCPFRAGDIGPSLTLGVLTARLPALRMTGGGLIGAKLVIGGGVTFLSDDKNILPIPYLPFTVFKHSGLPGIFFCQQGLDGLTMKAMASPFNHHMTQQRSP